MELRKTFRWIVYLLLAFTVVLTSWTVQAQEKSDLQTIRDRGVLRVGAAIAQPFYMIEPGKDKWTGLAPEIIELIAERLNVKVEYVEVKWGTAPAALQSGRIDIMGAFNATPERALAVDFTVPIGVINFGVIGFGDKLKNYSTWSDVDKKSVRLVSVDGTSSTKFMERKLKKVHWVLVQDFEQLFMQIESGRVDIALDNEIQALKFIEKRGKGKFKILKPVHGSTTNLAIRKAYPSQLRDWLNVTIECLQRQGELDEIWEKYKPSEQ